MKRNLQGLVCRSFRATLGDRMASYDLISQEVHLEPWSLEEQGTAHPLQSCLGPRERESLRSSATSPAHNPTEQRGVPGKVQSPSDFSAPWFTQAQPGGGSGLRVEESESTPDKERKIPGHGRERTVSCYEGKSRQSWPLTSCVVLGRVTKLH